MERSRSKRSYYYDQDSDSQTPPPPRTKGRYHHSSSHYSGGGSGGHHRRGGDRRPPPPPPPTPPPSSSSSSLSKFQDGIPPSGAVTTSFRILCPDEKAGGVIGKSGSIIKNFRQETGAWISVHPLAAGDDERIIETADNRRREPDGRPPQYSPAQEALLLIHERILDAGFEMEGVEEDDDYGWGGGGGDRDRGRVTTRLVVPRGHVGCLMGKGGKIIEQMRIETKTHIRILPRDHNTPRCVSMSEEIVQVVGESNAVKKAIAVISSRLKESLHRDRGPFRGRLHSPERFFPPDDEFTLNLQHRPEESDIGQRSSSGLSRARNSSYSSRSSSYPLEVDANPTTNHAQSFPYEELVFQILCPNDKVESVMGESAGILEMLRADVGVDVHLTDPVPGSDERIIMVTSEEGPNDELFPAQEALLHIQSHIVDLGPDKDNIITTRLLIPASEVGCLEGRDGTMCDLKRLSNANVQILPRDDLPLCALGSDEVVQIVGEIRAAREALVQITSRLRSYLYRDSSAPKDLQLPPISTPGHSGSIIGAESSAPNCEVNQGNDPSPAVYQDMQTETTAWKPEDAQGCGNGSMEQEGDHVQEDKPQNGPGRSSAPSAAQKTLEVVIPEQAVSSLMMRSGSKLAQISEMSGAKVSLIEDRPELTEKVVQICGSPEQAERAQSLLQGFILSSKFLLSIFFPTIIISSFISPLSFSKIITIFPFHFSTMRFLKAYLKHQAGKIVTDKLQY